MVGILNHIFINMSKNERSIKHISKVLKKQVKFNSAVGGFILIATTYMISEEVFNYKQDGRITALEKEIEELKNIDKRR